MKRKDLLDLLQRKFPEEYAEDWDNTGFIIDVGKNKYERILVALELVPEVLREAIELGVDIVITHHPIVFKPIKKLSAQIVEDSMIIECIKNDISVFAIHTNCDNYEGGTNDYLSELIGIKETEALLPLENICDTIPLANLQKKVGNGRVGRLNNPMTLKILLEKLKDILSAEALRYTGDENRIIDKVGLCSGSGSDLIREAYRRGVDCFLTGDIKYHDAQFARMNNMALVDIGHYESENIFKYALMEMLVEETETIMQTPDIMVSKEDINPFRFFK
jgi:dinuclear metal center YbgI/SA1388 family protein